MTQKRAIPALPEGMRELLGTKSDRNIGIQFDLCSTWVGMIRRRLGIAVYSPIPKWPVAAIKQLGKKPDSSIAKEFGYTREQVRSERIARGIAVFLKKQGTSKQNPPRKTPQHEWAPEDLALLGTMPDSTLAKQLGVSHRCVQEKRTMAGIPLHTPVPAYEGKLGTMSDAALAAETGYTKVAIKRARSVRNIPASGKRGRQSRKWTDEEIALLGKQSDISIADKLAISRKVVERKRQQLKVSRYLVANPE